MRYEDRLNRVRFYGLILVVLAIVSCVKLAESWSCTQPNPQIAALITQVKADTLIEYANQLTGVSPAMIEGRPYMFTTRETESGEPIEKATQFVYEFLAAQPLTVTYHEWSECGIENRNVVAEKVGAKVPEEIVLVTAHIDSTSETGSAPGADDNASGTAAVMMIAKILAPVQTERTLRFILFTGEEQGYCGSTAYANEVAEADEAIVAVYNMDMIAWNTQSEPVVRLYTRSTRSRGYTSDLGIAKTFVNVVNDYSLALSPQITPDSTIESDQYSFWQVGYPGILVIEDDGDPGDFNPYYHTPDDLVSAFNPVYYTNMVKASVGTVATLAGMAQTPSGREKLYLPGIQRR